MTGFSDYTAKKVLDHIVGKTAMGALPTGYIALFTAVGADDGTGFTEVAGGSYARVATAGADWNAAAGSSPSSNSNANAMTFPKPTADWGTVIALGIYDAATGGNLLMWDYLGNYPWLPATISAASPGVITAKGHGYGAGDKVVYSTEFGGTAPAVSQGNLTGLLDVVSPVADSFTVKSGATAVNTSGTGSGMVRKVAAQVISSGVVASFAGGTPGALVLSAA
ncbi:MAG: hypothetical protein J0H79_13915 [Alphaproteobacteria bacterium]|nr:hypothetical protein [Alphaproteobacteria bacterium]